MRKAAPVQKQAHWQNSFSHTSHRKDNQKYEPQDTDTCPDKRTSSLTREIFLLTKNLNMHSVMCVGGMDIRPQIKKLSRAHQFVIATPGRALDLIKKKFILAEKFNTVVLDEADRMLDMGFITDMRKIPLEKTPETRETLLFSATMNQASEKLADDFLKNPVTVSVKKTDVTQNIEQTIVHYQKQQQVRHPARPIKRQRL